MPNCRKCGKPSHNGLKHCRSCLIKWIEKRSEAYEATLKELGPITAENQKAFAIAMKKKEKK